MLNFYIEMFYPIYNDAQIILLICRAVGITIAQILYGKDFGEANDL